ncbi:hypothetical protein [Chondromyces apiculatus]|nr:hypothetical protein [Chondromyces apiculatus]
MSEAATAMASRFWRVTGILSTYDELELRLGYLSEEGDGSQEDPGSALVAKLYGVAGDLLLTHRVPVRPTEAGRARTVRGAIPFPTATRVIRFEVAGKVIEEIGVPAAGPEIELTWRPPERVRGKVRVTWRGEHPLGMKLDYFLRYSHTNGVTWSPISLRTPSEHQEIDFDQLPGGERCRIAVMATDGVNTRLARSSPFAVAIKPCRAVILEPSTPITAPAGSVVSLHGQGFWLEEGRPEPQHLAWESSLDGPLGNGERIEATLSPGTHRVTLTAGCGERAGTRETRVEITAHAGR